MPGTTGSDATVAWDPITNFSDCGQTCSIVSNDSPGGAVYLYYRQPAQNLYFIVDKGTFGKDEVTDVIASNGVFSAAVYLALEGFTVQQLTIDQPSLVAPTLGGTFPSLHDVRIVPSTTYPPVYDSTNLYTPQRILYPFDVIFTSTAALADFPASGLSAEPLDASITIGSATLGTSQQLSATTVLYLVAGADPYFSNVDPAQDNVFYLSQDLRVFTITPEANNAAPIDGVPFTFEGGSPTSRDTAAAYSYIQALIGHFNSRYADPGQTDPFDITNSVLPDQGGAYSGDSSVTPAMPNQSNPQEPFQNYSFALARVRLRGSSGPSGEAQGVRVFFRVFTTQTCDTDYINVAASVSPGDPNITYLSLPANAPNAPTSPLPGTDAGGTINGSTLPFFAAADQSDLAAGGVNNRLISIPQGSDAVWTYFGCHLNVYDPSVLFGHYDAQHWLAASRHNCIVAQIAYGDTPIENTNGVVETPENSDLLAQRNLQITPSGNPGFPSTHVVPQTFDTRPSPTPGVGYLEGYPDELMIDWGNTPRGATAEIYWPQVDSADVLALAAKLHAGSPLSAGDRHTLRCGVTSGMTYVPVPSGGGESFAGLITVTLPAQIRVGQQFEIVVRRVTSRRLGKTADARTKDVQVERTSSWRYVVGTFQMTIPVESDGAILPDEENLLSVLKWRLQRLGVTDRWYPVLQRYISVVTSRVRGLGGDPAKIAPSPQGTANQLLAPPPRHRPGDEESVEWTGKISALEYDRFGNFTGFHMITLAGEVRRFRGREREVEDIVREAWTERILLTVRGSRRDPEIPAEILLRGPPRRGRS